jgi:hypothetical protein
VSLSSPGGKKLTMYLLPATVSQKHRRNQGETIPPFTIGFLCKPMFRQVVGVINDNISSLPLVSPVDNMRDMAGPTLIER